MRAPRQLGLPLARRRGALIQKNGPRQAQKARCNGDRRDAAATTTGTAPAKPLPPRALAFLDGPTDEHRVAGLLLLAAADASSLQAHASEIAAKLEASNFLARLLKTAGDDGAALTSAQRAGLEVARALAGTSDDVRDALANSAALEACGACVLSVADARTMAARGDSIEGGSNEDAAAALRCLDSVGRRRPAPRRRDRLRDVGRRGVGVGRRAFTSLLSGRRRAALARGDVITKMLLRRRRS